MAMTQHIGILVKVILGYLDTEAIHADFTYIKRCRPIRKFRNNSFVVHVHLTILCECLSFDLGILLTLLHAVELIERL